MSVASETQVSGGKGKAGDDPVADGAGKGAGGESGGGGYKNPHKGKDGDNSGFMGHGGQTDIGYRGTGDADDDASGNANAATGT